MCGEPYKSDEQFGNESSFFFSLSLDGVVRCITKEWLHVTFRRESLDEIHIFLTFITQNEREKLQAVAADLELEKSQTAGDRKGENREKVLAHLLDAGIVNEAGVGAGASNDDLGPEQLGCHLHLVVVYKSRCRLQRNEEENRLRGVKREESV